MGSEILDSAGAAGRYAVPAGMAASGESIAPRTAIEALLVPELEFELEPAPAYGPHTRHGTGRPAGRPVRRHRPPPLPQPSATPQAPDDPARPDAPAEPDDRPPRVAEPTEPPGVLEASLALWTAVGRTIHDPADRRRTLRMGAAAVVLMLVTALAVHAHDDNVASEARAAELAVDVRLMQLSPDSRPADSNGFTGAGFASSEVLVHNVGPEAVRLLGLNVFVGGGVYGGDAQFPMLRTNTVVSPTEQLDQSYLVTLPCYVSRSQAGVGQITAQIRTSDGTVHAVPVDLTAIDSIGGLFAACRSFAFRPAQDHAGDETSRDLLGTTLQENR